MPGRHAAPRTPGPRTGGPVGRLGVAAILLTAAGAAVAGSTGAFAAAGAAAPAPTTQPPTTQPPTTQPPTVPAAETAMLALTTAVPAPTVLATPTVLAGPAIQPVVLPVAGPTTATVKYVAAVGGAPTKAVPAKPKAAPEAKAAPDTASAGSGGSIGSRIVAEAAKHKGAPYVWGATGPSSFDCSGFTRYVFKKMGSTLPRTAQAQYDAAQHLSRSQAQPGDLIFVGSPGSIYHVAIYAGNGKIWTAPQPGESVKLGNLWGDYRVGRIR